MNDPRTEAGRDLIARAKSGSWMTWAGDTLNLPGLRRAILAIEAEAATPGESRALVEALRFIADWAHDCITPQDTEGALAEVPVIPDELGAAWAEAEAALPRETGWFDVFRRDANFHDDLDHRYCAEAYTFRPSPDDVTRASVEDFAGFGPTPAAALRALAARLSEPPQ